MPTIWDAQSSPFCELARVVVRLDHVARLIVNANNGCVRHWEIIADNLSKAGWSWGYASVVDSNERMICIADAHRDDGKRFVERADEKVDRVLEKAAAIR